MRILRRLLPFVSLLLAPIAPARTDRLVIEPIPDQPFFAFDYDRATDFSGIGHREGDDYFVVSDKQSALFTMRIVVDPRTGRIQEGRITARHRVKSNFEDFEGVAYVPETHRVAISAEAGPGLVSVDPEGGDARDFAPPEIFKKIRKNKGLESLTQGGGFFWTANEEALEVDGQKGEEKEGTVVRLQRLNADFAPAGQYAYRTEASPGFEHATGVSDLLLMPDGELLVLERIATPLGLAAGIFAVDFKDATDTSRLKELRRGNFKRVEKKRLALIPTLSANFEGITLGPQLEGGWRSLILIADSGGAETHLLMPLRWRMAPDAPPPPVAEP